MSQAAGWVFLPQEVTQRCVTAVTGGYDTQTLLIPVPRQLLLFLDAYYRKKKLKKPPSRD